MITGSKKIKMLTVVMAVLIGGMVVASMVASAEDADPMLPGKGVKFEPVNDPNMDNVFPQAILSLILEELGYEWKNKPQLLIMNVPIMHTSVAKGDSPFNAAYWHPNQDNIFKEAGGGERSDNPKMFVAGTNIKGIVQGYMIDKKTAEKYSIKTMGDLKNPEIAKAFDYDGDGKADLVGCIPGWACADAINHHLEAYELTDTVTHLQAPYWVMFADMMARYKRGGSFLRHAWVPDWTHAVLKPDIDAVWLPVPFSAWHTDSDLDTTMPDGRNLGFPMNELLTAVNTKWAEENPAALRLMELFNIPIVDLNATIFTAHEEGEKFELYHKLAEKWIAENRGQVDSWLKEARAAAE